MSSGRLFQFYNSTTWKKVRQITLERDNYICQKCLEGGEITPAEVVHHIIEITPDNMSEYGLDLENLISWCRKCHEKFHGRLTESSEEDEYTFDSEGQIIPIMKG